MPLYYFDIYDRNGYHRDEFGDEFASLKDVYTQVSAVLLEMIRFESLDGNYPTIACELRDHTGQIVYNQTLTYRETQAPGEDST